MTHASREMSAVEQAIEWHRGDLIATIATLIDDSVFLCDKIETAERLSSTFIRSIEMYPGHFDCWGGYFPSKSRVISTIVNRSPVDLKSRCAPWLA